MTEKDTHWTNADLLEVVRHPHVVMLVPENKLARLAEECIVMREMLKRRGLNQDAIDKVVTTLQDVDGKEAAS